MSVSSDLGSGACPPASEAGSSTGGPAHASLRTAGCKCDARPPPSESSPLPAPTSLPRRSTASRDACPSSGPLSTLFGCDLRLVGRDLVFLAAAAACLAPDPEARRAFPVDWRARDPLDPALLTLGDRSQIFGREDPRATAAARASDRRGSAAASGRVRRPVDLLGRAVAGRVRTAAAPVTARGGRSEPWPAREGATAARADWAPDLADALDRCEKPERADTPDRRDAPDRLEPCDPAGLAGTAAAGPTPRGVVVLLFDLLRRAACLSCRSRTYAVGSNRPGPLPLLAAEEARLLRALPTELARLPTDPRLAARSPATAGSRRTRRPLAGAGEGVRCRVGLATGWAYGRLPKSLS